MNLQRKWKWSSKEVRRIKICGAPEAKQRGSGERGNDKELPILLKNRHFLHRVVVFGGRVSWDLVIDEGMFQKPTCRKS